MIGVITSDENNLNWDENLLTTRLIQPETKQTFYGSQ